MFPIFFPYRWSENDITTYFSSHNDERIGGVILPFLGGVLLGGLLMPRPNTYVPIKTMPYYGPMGPIYQPPFLGASVMTPQVAQGQ